MKAKILIFTISLLLLAGFCFVHAQEEDVEVAAVSESAEGLDLQAVSDLFQEAENLEDFERALNDPDLGINNLDLDENGEVDFIRVIEEVSGETHVIVLQVPLGEEDYQDVATIEVEKDEDGNVNMQAHGNDDFYGPDYYVAPTVVVNTWPIITWMYRASYKPYRSIYRFGYYPRWWKPWRPVAFAAYHARVIKRPRRQVFVVRNTSRVRTVHRVKYKPRRSTRVVKRTTVTRKPGGKKVIRTTTVKKKPGKKAVVKKTTVRKKR